MPATKENKMPERKSNPGTSQHVEHVSQHLTTPKIAPDKGMTVRGEPHTGPVAGTMPAHIHQKVTHFYKKGE